MNTLPDSPDESQNNERDGGFKSGIAEIDNHPGLNGGERALITFVLGMTALCNSPAAHNIPEITTEKLDRYVAERDAKAALAAETQAELIEIIFLLSLAGRPSGRPLFIQNKKPPRRRAFLQEY